MEDPKEFLEWINSRMSFYRHLNTLVTSSMSSDEFNGIVRDVIDGMQCDSESYFNFCRNGTSIPVISKAYSELSSCSRELLQGLSFIKNLMGF